MWVFTFLRCKIEINVPRTRTHGCCTKDPGSRAGHLSGKNIRICVELDHLVKFSQETKNDNK